ncbi:hypothetical protein D3C76_1201420 [compost metagenome]
MLSTNFARSNWAIDSPPLTCGVLSRSLTFSSPSARNWLAETLIPVHSATLAALSSSNCPWAAKVMVLPCNGSPATSPDNFMSSSL